MTKIEVPLYITLPRKTKKDKKYMLNLNQYRNWHYIISNQLKHRFCEALECVLRGLKLKDELDITYTLYKGSKRKIDRANILCIIEKFFCDALVFYEVIPDDNDDYIKATHYYSDYDKDNPRVEIIIKTYDKSN